VLPLQVSVSLSLGLVLG